jgi:hypothetical protein
MTKLTATNPNLARSKDLKRKKLHKSLVIEHHPFWPLSHGLDQIAAITMI